MPLKINGNNVTNIATIMCTIQFRYNKTIVCTAKHCFGSKCASLSQPRFQIIRNDLILVINLQKT